MMPRICTSYKVNKTLKKLLCNDVRDEALIALKYNKTKQEAPTVSNNIRKKSLLHNSYF